MTFPCCRTSTQITLVFNSHPNWSLNWNGTWINPFFFFFLYVFCIFLCIWPCFWLPPVASGCDPSSSSKTTLKKKKKSFQVYISGWKLDQYFLVGQSGQLKEIHCEHSANQSDFHVRIHTSWCECRWFLRWTGSGEQVESRYMGINLVDQCCRLGESSGSF